MKNNNYLIILFFFTGLTVSNLAAQQLKVTGGYLKINNSSVVLKDMNLINDGNLTASVSTVAFTGTSTSTISGINSPTFDSLAINKTSGAVQLEQSINIDSHLELSAGLLDLQDSDASLAADATIGNPSSTTYVQTSGAGTLVQQVADSDVTFPIGNSSYNPAILNNDGGTSDFYALRVRDELLEDGTMGDAVTSSYVCNEVKKARKLIEKILIWHHAGTEASSAKQHFTKCMYTHR